MNGERRTMRRPAGVRWGALLWWGMGVLVLVGAMMALALLYAVALTVL